MKNFLSVNKFVFLPKLVYLEFKQAWIRYPSDWSEEFVFVITWLKNSSEYDSLTDKFNIIEYKC